MIGTPPRWMLGQITREEFGARNQWNDMIENRARQIYLARGGNPKWHHDTAAKSEALKDWAAELIDKAETELQRLIMLALAGGIA